MKQCAHGYALQNNDGFEAWNQHFMLNSTAFVLATEIKTMKLRQRKKTRSLKKMIFATMFWAEPRERDSLAKSFTCLSETRRKKNAALSIVYSWQLQWQRAKNATIFHNSIRNERFPRVRIFFLICPERFTLSSKCRIHSIRWNASKKLFFFPFLKQEKKTRKNKFSWRHL